MFLLINHKLIRKEKKHCTELQYRPHTEYDFVLDVVFPIAPECLEYCTNTTICKQKSIRIRAKQLQTQEHERSFLKSPGEELCSSYRYYERHSHIQQEMINYV